MRVHLAFWMSGDQFMAGLLSALLLFMGMEQEVSSELFQPKSLQREFAPVILTGENLPRLAGKEIVNMRLYAIHRGECVPIPFQIDERCASGSYAYQKGKNSRRDDDNGLLDNNDELVFMAKDTGDQESVDPCPTGWETFHEIEVLDPLNGEKGWGYLMFYSKPPAPSSIDYIRFDPESHLIETPQYVLGFTNEDAPAAMDYFAFANESGPLVDILDRFKMHVRASFLWGSFKVARDESDLRMKVTAYTDGPVRVLEEVIYSMVVVPGFPSPSTNREATSYLYYTVFPNEFTVPFDLGVLLTDITVLFYLDFNEHFAGALFSNEYNSTETVMDGVMSRDEDALDRRFSKWALVKRGEQAIVGRVLVGDAIMNLPVKKSFFYLDEVNILNPPEESPGHFGTIGWLLENLKKFEGGDFFLQPMIFFSRHYREGDEKDFFNVEDHPLVAAVR